jgi:hypothetical protein
MKNNPTRVCCRDCYFRRVDLCALQFSEACPTFRPYTSPAFAQQEPIRLPQRPLPEVVRTQLKIAAV